MSSLRQADGLPDEVEDAATDRSATQALPRRCGVATLPSPLPAQPVGPVPKGNAEMVAAAVRTIFAQPDDQHVHAQLDVISGMLGKQLGLLKV